MYKKSIHSRLKEKKVNKEYFTGKSTIKEVSPYLKSQEQNIYHVSFFNGAKTKIHIHDAGQILIPTRGDGILEIFKKKSPGKNRFMIKKIKTIKLKVGEIAYIPPKNLHSHGALGKALFSHIAINAFPKKKIESKTMWFESDFRNKVTKRLD